MIDVDDETHGRLKNAIQSVVDRLADGDYAGVELLTGGVRLTAAMLREAVAEYGKTLVRPPESAFKTLDARRIRNRTHAAYSVRFRLYTLEEGISDLEVQLTVEDTSGRGSMRIEVDGVLVA